MSVIVKDFINAALVAGAVWAWDGPSWAIAASGFIVLHCRRAD